LIHTPFRHRFRPDPWGKLCYMNRTDKTLWGRKSLARYAMAARRRDNNAETMYQFRIYSFYSACDAHVKKFLMRVCVVPLRFIVLALLFILMIFYTTILPFGSITQRFQVYMQKPPQPVPGSTCQCSFFASSTIITLITKKIYISPTGIRSRGRFTKTERGKTKQQTDPPPQS